ncbi:MAG: hybrid sensor histidine kinase/response regulator [Candidatus Zixiibacteriota bacterium]|nr:MAG: hybrid sensor histidine kinase/response regulator [candidate division Zixibacteria bacterium]
MPDETVPPFPPQHLLVVDDDAMIREVLQTRLERAGYRVTPAGSGEEALAAVAAGLPDLVVLDVRMPGIDGYEVCRRLRAAEETRTLPVLMLTAYGGVDHTIQGLKAGADDYVSKPFHPEEVLMRIRALLRMRRIESELREKEIHRARAETLSQLLVTMAHHINNSLAVIEGRAQVTKPDNAEQAQRLKDACVQQSRRIQAVLASLESLVRQVKLDTVHYAGSTLTMLDIEAEIRKRLHQAGSGEEA